MYLKTVILLCASFSVLTLQAQKVFKAKFTINRKGYNVEYITSRVYIGQKEIHITEPGNSKTYKIKKKKIDGPWKMYKVKNFWIKELPEFVKLEFSKKNFIMYSLFQQSWTDGSTPFKIILIGMMSYLKRILDFMPWVAYNLIFRYSLISLGTRKRCSFTWYFSRALVL